MEDPTPQLTDAPIIEAVLDIDCDLPQGSDHEKIDAAARERFAESFPNFKRQHVTHHELRQDQNQNPELRTIESIGALQYLSHDEKEIVQFRPNGFSFNRLAPYSSFDDYLPTIKTAWETYLDLAEPLKISRISLRTINRLSIPFEKDGRLSFGEYFRAPPTLPTTGLPLAFTGFLEQHMAIDQETRNRIRLVKSTQEQVEDALPVVLDIDVFHTDRMECSDWGKIFDRIISLRSLKNKVFMHILTDRCLSLFSPQD